MFTFRAGTGPYAAEGVTVTLFPNAHLHQLVNKLIWLGNIGGTQTFYDDL